MQQYQHLPVNWINGMKINQSHFILQEQAFTCLAAAGVGSLLNECNYGLLPGTATSRNSLQLTASADNQRQVQVRLSKCRAITLGGHTIGFDEEGDNRLSTPLPHLDLPFSSIKGQSAEYFVVLTVHPYHRIPCGYADPSEMPFRLPHTAPSYSLELLPVYHTHTHAFGYFQLPVALLQVNEQKISLDDNYIPPCCSVNSHPGLLEAHAYLERFLKKAESYGVQIVQRILQKKQQNDLAAIAHKICEQTVLFCTAAIDQFGTTTLLQPPLFMINLFARLARLLKNTLDFYLGTGKEEWVNYCNECCDVNQSQLEGAIHALVNHRYSHVHTGEAVCKVLEFARLFDRLLSALVNQEYIGRYRDSRLFVKEEPVVDAVPESNRKKWKTLLAD